MSVIEQVASVSNSRKRKSPVSAEEEAANYDKPAAEERLKGQTVLLKAIIKRHPMCVPHALQTSQNLGYTTTSPVAEMSSSRQKVSYADREVNMKNDVDKKTKEVAKCLNIDVKDVIPLCKEKLDLTIPQLQSNCLVKIEPSSFSVSNIRAMFARMARSPTAESNKDVVLKIIDCATGLPSNLPLSGKLRSWSGLGSLCAQLNQTRNRPARDILLPPEWDGHDVAYKLDNKSDDLVVEIACLGEASRIIVPLDIFQYRSLDFEER